MSNLLARALVWKYPNANFDTQDGKISAWRSLDIKQPDAIECKAIIDEYVNFKAKNLYKDRRALEYPPISEQLDLIYKTLKFLKTSGTNVGPDGEEHIARIDAVKMKYPKPS